MGACNELVYIFRALGMDMYECVDEDEDDGDDHDSGYSPEEALRKQLTEAHKTR